MPYNHYSVEEVVKNFEKMAMDMNAQARVFLISIYVLLLAGILIIIFAAEINAIGRSESSVRENFDNTKLIIESIDKIIDEKGSLEDSLVNIFIDIQDSTDNYFYDSLQNLEYINIEYEGPELGDLVLLFDSGKLEFPGYNDDFYVTDTTTESFYDDEFLSRERYYSFLGQLLLDTLGPAESEIRQAYLLDEDSLNDTRTALIKDRNILQSRLDQERLGLVKSYEVNGFLTPQFIENTITRFGTLVIILFLVRILIPQYRYKLRLSSYYQARADALALIKSEELKENVEFERLLSGLTPEIPFGKEPETPYDRLIELANIIKKGS